MRKLVVVVLGLSLFMISCKRENINSPSAPYEDVNAAEGKKENDFFFSLEPSEPDNPSNVALCTWSGGSQLCRNDWSLSEACQWMQTCNSTYPGAYTNWTIDGGDTSVCFT